MIVLIGYQIQVTGLNRKINWAYLNFFRIFFFFLSSDRFSFSRWMLFRELLYISLFSCKIWWSIYAYRVIPIPTIQRKHTLAAALASAKPFCNLIVSAPPCLSLLAPLSSVWTTMSPVAVCSSTDDQARYVICSRPRYPSWLLLSQTSTISSSDRGGATVSSNVFTPFNVRLRSSLPGSVIRQVGF